MHYMNLHLTFDIALAMQVHTRAAPLWISSTSVCLLIYVFNNYVCYCRLSMGDSDELFARIIAGVKIPSTFACSTQSKC